MSNKQQDGACNISTWRLWQLSQLSLLPGQNKCKYTFTSAFLSTLMYQVLDCPLSSPRTQIGWVKRNLSLQASEEQENLPMNVLGAWGMQNQTSWKLCLTCTVSMLLCVQFSGQLKVEEEGSLSFSRLPLLPLRKNVYQQFWQVRTLDRVHPQNAFLHIAKSLSYLSCSIFSICSKTSRKDLRTCRQHHSGRSFQKQLKADKKEKAHFLMQLTVFCEVGEGLVDRRVRTYLHSTMACSSYSKMLLILVSEFQIESDQRTIQHHWKAFILSTFEGHSRDFFRQSLEAVISNLCLYNGLRCLISCVLEFLIILLSCRLVPYFISMLIFRLFKIFSIKSATWIIGI